MLSIEPLITKESKSCPGVTFTVRSLSRRERAAREFKLIEARAELADLFREFQAVRPPAEGTPDERTPEQKKQAAIIDAKYVTMMDRDIKPAYITAGIVSIDGIVISGKPATPEELLLTGGPEADGLFDEIFAACDETSGLTEDQSKNSEPPTISNEPAAGEESGSKTAEPVAA